MKLFFSIFLIVSLLSTPSCIQKIETKSITIESDNNSTSKSIQIDTTQLYPVNSKDTLQPIFLNTANYLWDTFVQKEGQATTLQGELIRAIEKLEHEITGNGKINWNEQHEILACSLRDSLLKSGIFPASIQTEIKNDINILIRDEYEVYTDNDVYDRLTRRIVEWYWRNKNPITRKMNPKLKI